VGLVPKLCLLSPLPGVSLISPGLLLGTHGLWDEWMGASKGASPCSLLLGLPAASFCLCPQTAALLSGGSVSAGRKEEINK
jgi:hypothetical protein